MGFTLGSPLISSIAISQQIRTISISPQLRGPRRRSHLAADSHYQGTMSQSNDANLDLDDVDLDIEVHENVDAGVVEPTKEKPKKQRASRKRSKVWDHYNSFSADDWDDVRKLTGFLSHFYEVTLKVSKTKFVTSNTFLDDITCIDVLLRKCMNESDDFNLVEMAGLMRVKFDKYYGKMEKHNMLVFVASLLDPRNKYTYMEIILVDVYGKVDGLSMLVSIKEVVQEIYDEYVRIHSPVVPSIAPSSSIPSLSGKRNSPADMEPSKVLKDKFRMEMKRRKEESGLIESKSDLDKYLKEENEEDSSNFSLLDWWKVNSPRFPILSLMARDVFAIPVSTVASESVFSTSGRVLDTFRSSLTPKVVQALICCQDWLRVNSSPIDIEEACDDLLQLEEEYEDGASGNKTC